MGIKTHSATQRKRLEGETEAERPVKNPYALFPQEKIVLR